MADVKTRQAIVDIVVNEGKALDALKRYQDELAKSRAEVQRLEEAEANGEITKEEMVRAINEENVAQKALKKEMRDVEYQLQKTIQRQTENEGSLKSLRGELSNLTAQYDSLSKAEREDAEVGGKLKDRISEVYNELKKAEEGTGRFQRNVGNYGMKSVEAFSKVAGAAGSVINPIKNMTVGLEVMSATPVIAVLGLLANLLTKVAGAMKSSEEQMNRLNGVFGIFRGLGDASVRVMQKLGNAVAKAAEWMGKAAEKLGLITDLMKEEQEIGKEDIAIRREQREVMVKNAQDELEYSRLRAEAVDNVKYSDAERLEMLQRADNLEKGIAERNLTLAQRELENLRRKAALTENDTEMLDKLAAAEAKTYEVQREYYSTIMRLKSQVVSATKAVNAEEDNARKGMESNDAAMLREAEKNAEAMIRTRQEELETRLRLVEKGSEEEMEAQKELLTFKHEREMEELSEREGTQELMRLKEEEYQRAMLELETTYEEEQARLMEEETNKAIEEAERRYEAEKEIEERRVEMRQATALAIGGALGQLSELMEQAGEENKAIAKMSKVLALAQIAIETGVATAKGISQAQSVPFPANIAAIATTLATIVGGMTSAVSTVKSAKFARGGLVVGEGTGTSDSVPAMLSNGESVMTAQTTSMFAPLLSSLNQMGGGNAIEAPVSGGSAMLEQAIARGMRGANLKVSVREIDTVKERMESIDEIANV